MGFYKWGNAHSILIPGMLITFVLILHLRCDILLERRGAPLRGGWQDAPQPHHIFELEPEW